MEWIHTLFFESGIGHSILLVAIVISVSYTHLTLPTTPYV